MSRRSKLNYFGYKAGDPAPLAAEVKRTVRFEEVDPLRIVWHGRYPSYFEDGRAAFGKRYGLGYLDMYENGFLAPIIQLHIDHHTYLEFGEEFTIRAKMHWTEANKINFSYEIIKENGQAAATGYTVQLLTDTQREIMLIRPAFMETFFEKWKENRLI